MYTSLPLASEPVIVTSSRTDRGVHALCSSVHVDLHHQLVSHLVIVIIAVLVLVCVLVGHCLHGDGIWFLELIPSTSLNGSLRNFNTWCVSVSNRTLRRDFLGISPQKIRGPKTTYMYFWRLHNSMATLKASIFSEEHDIHNWETALETMNGPLHCPKISWTSGT